MLTIWILVTPIRFWNTFFVTLAQSFIRLTSNNVVAIGFIRAINTICVKKQTIKNTNTYNKYIIHFRTSKFFSRGGTPKAEGGTTSLLYPLYRVGGAGGFGGAQAPPSFLDLFSKNFQNLQNFHNFIFFIYSGPP